MILDKTGTLTQGKHAVTDLVPAPGTSEEDLLGTSAALERSSEHPLARAIVEAAEQRGIAIPSTEDFRYFTGKGTRGLVRGSEILAGNRRLMEERDVGIATLESEAERLQEEGKTVTFVARGEELIGLIAMADVVRPTSRAAIRELHDLGVEVAMMTGDNWGVARAVAADLGIDRVLAEVLPEHKAAEVAKLQREARIVAMVGDGINDAPALAQADVGMAIGSGTDVAIESADIALVKNDVFDVARTVHLSRATMKNIRQNLFFAFVYNGLGVPVAAGVLYPFSGILLSPMIAAGAMAASSISVVVNALRLKTFWMPPSPTGAEPATVRRPIRTEGTPAVAESATTAEEEAMQQGSDTATDPVCGMEVRPQNAAGTSDYDGQTYFFCSTGCRTRFDENPAAYAGKE